jgi:multiple sugar transport system substrate-binding protein
MNRNEVTRRGFFQRGGAAIAAVAVGGAIPATPGRAAGAKLVFWQLPMFSPQADKIQKEQVYAYAKGAGLQEADVEFVVVSEDTYIAKLTAAIEAGTPPDLVLVADSDAALFLGKGHLLDVTAVVDKMKKEPGGLNPACLIPGTAGGRNYGVPVGINALPFHSRVDLLEKAKLEYPKTWDAFVEACKKVQKPPFYGYGMSLGFNDDSEYNILTVCWAFGGKVLDDKDAVVFNSKANVDAFQLIADMVSKHKIIPQAALSWDSSGNNKAYISEQVAFVQNAMSVWANISQNKPELAARTGLFPAPDGPAGSQNPLVMDYLIAFKKSPNPERAAALLEYMFKPQNYERLIVETGGRFIPIYPKLFETDFWRTRPQFRHLPKMAQTGVLISHSGRMTSKMGEVINQHVIVKGLHRVIVDGVPAEKAVADVHAQIETIYRRPA